MHVIVEELRDGSDIVVEAPVASTDTPSLKRRLSKRALSKREPAKAKRERTKPELSERERWKRERAKRRRAKRAATASLRRPIQRARPKPPEAPKPAGPTKTQVGNAGEERAVQYLRERGYRIVERNFKLDMGELDIIARDDDILVFVEVRSRADDTFGDAAEAVRFGKQRRVAHMAEMYLGLRTPCFEEARFDVVAITGDRIELIQDAWRLGQLWRR